MQMRDQSEKLDLIFYQLHLFWHLVIKLQ